MLDDIIIVGTGWAGLAAAFQLCQQGKKVILLEASSKPGGRARSISFGEEIVDNGQHLLVGAYQGILKILEILHIPESDAFLRLPQEWHLYSKDSKISLKLPSFKTPWNLVFALFTAKGLSFKDRFCFMRFWMRLQALDFQLQKDLSVLEFLREHHQTERLIQKVWSPLCLAALTTPIESASASVLLTVLKNTYQHHKHSDFLFPKQDLSELLPNPLISFLKQNGAEIQYSERVLELLYENNRCMGVRTSKQVLKAKEVLLCTSLHETLKLLSPLNTHKSLVNQLRSFEHQPITTVYLRYPFQVKLPFPMMGLSDGTAQWIFDRRITSQPHILSVVISGNGPHLFCEKTELLACLRQDLKIIHPQLDSFLEAKIITEKRAAFSCVAGIKDLRPGPQTAIQNLWLAGDFLNTHYPTSLEGAVQSGFWASDLILLNNHAK